MQLYFIPCTLLFLTCQHLAHGERWVNLDDIAYFALLSSVKVRTSLLARFLQPLWAVLLDTKNSVSALFSHLSPTYSLSSFLFQYILPLSPCHHCHRRQKKLSLLIYCFLFLLGSLNSFTIHTIERSILISL